MNKTILTIILFSFSFMQDIDKAGWSYEAKATYYLAEKISPENALMLQFSVPIPFVNLGYAYSDNWKKGLRLDGIMLGSLLLASEAYGEIPPDCRNHCDIDNEDEIGDLLTLISLGTLIYKYIDVYNSAETYNDNLYNKVFGGQRSYFSMEYNKQNNGALLALNFPIK